MSDPEIIFEDDDCVVANKPAGLMVHGDGRTSERTLVDWLVKKYPSIKDVGEPLDIDGTKIFRSGIVHRLDKDTSGVLVVAKTQSAYEFFKKQFQDRTIEKVYRALVYGNIADASGEVVLPIGKSRRDPLLWSADKNARGTLRDACTIYKVLERFKNPEAITYLEVYPKTGRTHQIRVHMKAIFHPIVGDPLYAPGKPSLPGLSRQALHALSLELSLPSGERKKFEASLPLDFEDVVAFLRKTA